MPYTFPNPTFGVAAGFTPVPAHDIAAVLRACHTHIHVGGPHMVRDGGVMLHLDPTVTPPRVSQFVQTFARIADIRGWKVMCMIPWVSDDGCREGTVTIFDTEGEASAVPRAPAPSLPTNLATLADIATASPPYTARKRRGTLPDSDDLPDVTGHLSDEDEIARPIAKRPRHDVDTTHRLHERNSLS